MLDVTEIENHITAGYDSKNLEKHPFKYIRFVSMVYLTFLLAATIVSYRVVMIGPVSEPGSTIIYTFSFFIANIYAELYGARSAKRLIYETIICGYLFALLLTGVNVLPAPSYWNNTDAYNQVLGHILRFTNAGIIGYLLSSILNIHLISKWKWKMNGRYFWIRSLLASSISESVATFIAGLITFIGMMPTKSILLIMTNALIFKILYGFIAIWPASFFVFILRRIEVFE